MNRNIISGDKFWLCINYDVLIFENLYFTK